MHMISLRPAVTDDSSFVFMVKREALRESIAKTWGWDETWQKQYHDEHFDPARYQIITMDSVDIGCISIDEQPEELYIAVLELLPAFQNRGIGTGLIQDLITRAKIEGKSVTLEVLKVNKRAKKLYMRLGFGDVPSEKLTHYRMAFATDQ
jgi:ribosomal protein S18 acetylase RimI-like enzyme